MQTKSTQYILNLGSRVYVGSTVLPQQRFAAIALQSYKTEIKSLDFGNPINASNEINAWVSNTTEGRIASLVKAGIKHIILKVIKYSNNTIILI